MHESTSGSTFSVSSLKNVTVVFRRFLRYSIHSLSTADHVTVNSVDRELLSLSEALHSLPEFLRGRTVVLSHGLPNSSRSWVFVSTTQTVSTLSIYEHYKYISQNYRKRKAKLAKHCKTRAKLDVSWPGHPHKISQCLHRIMEGKCQSNAKCTDILQKRRQEGIKMANDVNVALRREKMTEYRPLCTDYTCHTRSVKTTCLSKCSHP